MAGGPAEAAGHYTRDVVSAAYRRGLYAAGAAITQAATELPQDQLFEHLVSIGRERRTATDRMHRITTVLVPAGVSALPGTLRPAPRKGHPHDEQQ
jgi:hypothetical protein